MALKDTQSFFHVQEILKGIKSKQENFQNIVISFETKTLICSLMTFTCYTRDRYNRISLYFRWFDLRGLTVLLEGKIAACEAIIKSNQFYFLIDLHRLHNNKKYPRGSLVAWEKKVWDPKNANPWNEKGFSE